MIETIDSYLKQIQTQMVTVDPTQEFGPIVNSRDWPMDAVKFGALYLLFLNAIPIRGGTMAQTLFEYQCQWVWLLQGTDITRNSKGQNRGDRYRQNFTIIDNLNQANFPSYCQKKSASLSGTTVVFTPVSSVYPVSSTEQIWWTNPKFMPKQDNGKTGVVYGSATVSVYGWNDVLPALAA